MVRTIDIATLIARHADGAFVLDVREPGEYLAGHVPGALLAPMSRITSALGTLGRPGIVMISPQIATTNPAPALRRTSRTGTEKPVGAPRRSGSVVKLY